KAQVAMGHFSATKHNRDLDLGAFLEKIHNLVALGFKIVDRGAGPHLDFLQPDRLLILARLVLPLAELIKILSVVDDAAYGRIGRRRNLHQIQALSFSGFQRVEGSHDAKLPPLFINYPDFLGANPFVYSSESVGDKSSLPAPQGCNRLVEPPF